MESKLQQIKDEYATEKHCTDWWELLEHVQIKQDELDIHDEIAKRYAIEVAKASLEKASENATISTPWHPSMDGTKNVNKESIINEENIVLI